MKWIDITKDTIFPENEELLFDGNEEPPMWGTIIKKGKGHVLRTHDSSGEEDYHNPYNYSRYLDESPVEAAAKGTKCVFCGEVCKPAPTKRGWASVGEHGKGLHFDCAKKVASLEIEVYKSNPGEQGQEEAWLEMFDELTQICIGAPIHEPDRVHYIIKKLKERYHLIKKQP